jgi:hypothetical protein
MYGAGFVTGTLILSAGFDVLTPATIKVAVCCDVTYFIASSCAIVSRMKNLLSQLSGLKSTPPNKEQDRFRDRKTGIDDASQSLFRDTLCH